MTATGTFGFLEGFGPSGGLAYYLMLGMVATVNPCGFAMLPAYLSYFLGLEESAEPDTGHPAEQPSAGPTQALRVALTVSAGFMAVFALAGLAVHHTSLPVYSFAPWISVIIGVALIGLGIAMLRGFELVVNLPKLNRGGRERTAGSMFVFGLSYAVASIGCTLPIFLAAVAGTMDRDSVVDGLVAFSAYGAGMAVVLSALTVSLAFARTSLVAVLRSARRYVNRVAGALVVLAGAYVAFYGTLELRTYRAGSPGSIPSSSITDQVASWSYDINDWISRTGSVRLGMALLGLTAAVVIISKIKGRPNGTPGAPPAETHLSGSGPEPDRLERQP